MKVALIARTPIALAAIDVCRDLEKPPRHYFVVTKPGAPTRLRRQLYEAQADLMVLDERVGIDDGFKIMASIAALTGKTPNRVIGLFDGLNQRRRELAAMAGCFDAIDLTDPAWCADLAESIRFASAPAVEFREELVAPSVAEEEPSLKLVR
jgi:DNA-binding NarL/FixJ family response regulator